MVRLYQRKGGEVLVDTGTADNQASQSVPMLADSRVVTGWSQAEAQAAGPSFAQSDPPADPAGGPDAISVPGDDNTYYVDDPATKIEEGPFGGNDRVFTSVSYVLTRDSQIELLSTNDHASTNPINLTGNGWSQTLIGNAGRNILHGGGGSDLLIGLGGDDIYYTDVSSTRLVEYVGGGNDALYVSVSYSLEVAGEVELLSTNDHLSTRVLNLTGNRYGQTIIGNDGDSLMDGGGGVDTLIGLGGNDLYYVDVAATRVIEYEGGGNDQVYVSVSYVLGAGAVETLAISTRSQAEAINLTGNAYGQSLVGNAFANILDGGGGTDLLIGLGGNDIYYVDVAATQILEYQSGGADIAYVSLSYTLGGSADVETLSTNNNGATAAINLTGNLYAQTLIGNAGANVLNGGGGTDLLMGLAGNDTYYVDVAAAQIVEYEGGGNDIAYASLSYTLGGSADVETLSVNDYGSTRAINLTGNLYDQVLIGNAGANTLHGGGGVDTLIGLGGNDIYYVDVAGTQVSEAAGGGTDAIYTSISYALAAGNEVEILSSNNYGATDAISLTGNASAQVVTGNAGANTLNGGAGADTLHGLGGADNFAFTTALGGGNVDAIADFSVADDTIQLDDAIFAAIGPMGALNPNAFATGAAAADGDDRVIYNSATGQLFYDADGNGMGAALQFATLASGLALTANDFQVI
jgi:Ca2+-binding RTX toxin-like protein